MSKKRWKNKNYRTAPYRKYDKPDRKNPTTNNPEGNDRREERRKIKELFGGCCLVCGYDKTYNALEFHHIDASSKISSVSKAVKNMGYEAAFSEAMKCLLVCANCHRELEEGITKLPSGICAKQRRIVKQNIHLNREASDFIGLSQKRQSA